MKVESCIRKVEDIHSITKYEKKKLCIIDLTMYMIIGDYKGQKGK